MDMQTQDLINQWIIIVSSPKIAIPIAGGIGLGILASFFPLVTRLKRQSDKNFYVYLTNAVGSGGLFIFTQFDKPLATILSMLILVCFLSIMLPWWYFTIYKRNKP